MLCSSVAACSDCVFSLLVVSRSKILTGEFTCSSVSLCIKSEPSRFLLGRECESFRAPESLPNVSASTCFLPLKSFLVFNLTELPIDTKRRLFLILDING
ncbi:hypothetical protein MtrunA17_Chr6g0480891 [Medicago truncatula]|uniref:Uncharacterized protein n=1 Tax=Medicago truncatula TaxID=3880 RepID=A0A396HIM1_MEDTR|nr:hypothetical protein MtrunA17_Chr6g0480891 [Medicago truncatula]